MIRTPGPAESNDMNSTAKPIVLIVDGAAHRLIAMHGVLRDLYDIELADDGQAALAIARQVPRPELVLLAAALPGTPDGYEVCRALKASPDTAAIPVLMLLDVDGDADAGAEIGIEEASQRAFAAGAADAMPLPVPPDALRARVATHLQLRQSRALLRDEERRLEHLVEQRTDSQNRMFEAMVWAMASLAETREYETANHIRRIQHYVEALARQLQSHPHFADELSDEHIRLLYQAAPLHDIGKVSIPDAILLKPGRLTDDEFTIMKLHTLHGRDVIAGVERHLGYSNTFLRYAREIAHSHQERYDGSGYPQGLAGEAIPMSARLMAVADVYDALISRRVYKPAFTHETALELVRQGSGEHFDPDVVDAMLMVEEQFMEIAQRFADRPDGIAVGDDDRASSSGAG
jgi:putative two-component system response regulator